MCQELGLDRPTGAFSLSDGLVQACTVLRVYCRANLVGTLMRQVKRLAADYKALAKVLIDG